MGRLASQPSGSPLIRLLHVSHHLCSEHLFAKLEYATITGNHKYRFAETAVARFTSGSWSGISVASCGHLASSLAYICTERTVRCQIFVPQGCPIPIPTSPYVTLDTTSATYEESVSASREFCVRHSSLDATPGGYLASAYRDTASQITTEILQQAETLPDLIVCPVGNGTTIAGIYEGFKRTMRRVPLIFGVSIASNALTGKAFTGNAGETHVSDWDMEPLCAADPLDARAAETAVLQSGGQFVCVSPHAIRDAAKRLQIDEGLPVHPAAAAAFAGWEAIVTRIPRLARKRAILILTAQR